MTARFSIVPADAFEDDRLTPADVRVLGVLGSFLDRKNECFPSQAMVAERAKLDRSTVNRSLKKLVDFNYITARQRHPGRAKSVLLYQVKLDELHRAEAGEIQAELFDLDEARPVETPTKSHVAKNNMQEAETQQNCMLENATSVKSDVLSGSHIDVLSSSHTRTPHLTPQPSVSNETGLAAEGDDSADQSPATSHELKKSVVFNTGRLLLCGHGVSKKAAGTFLGRLVKDYGLDAAFSAIGLASKDPPGDPQAWLVKAAESIARRAGRRVPERKSAPAPEIDWTDAVAKFVRSRIWPRHLGPRPDEWGYRGTLAAIEAVFATGRFGMASQAGLKDNLDRLRAEQAA